MAEPILEYRAIDKTGWGPGAWQDEPDKVQWIDAATDLDCMIRRSPCGGNWCGYVGLPPSHPWHSHSYYEIGCDVDVHGGLTFSDACETHADEATGICHVPFPGRPADVWWLGFDCGHAEDIAPAYDARYQFPPFAGDQYRDIDYVREQVKYLASQLKAVV